MEPAHLPRSASGKLPEPEPTPPPHSHLTTRGASDGPRPRFLVALLLVRDSPYLQMEAFCNAFVRCAGRTGIATPYDSPGSKAMVCGILGTTKTHEVLKCSRRCISHPPS